MKKYKLIIFDADGTLTPLRGGALGNFSFELLPGVREKCAALRAEGVRLGIASNQSIKRADRAIQEQLSWTAGAIGISGTDVGLVMAVNEPFLQKPDSYMLEEIMKSADVCEEETLFVGDWETDKLAAENAGVDFIFASDFFSGEVVKVATPAG